jgi:hypothetical protein
MSAENQLNPSEPKAAEKIETVYTTVESQPDQTDWLTVVGNLRQINRQLVEQIARLEQALASSKQTLHTYKEEKQTHEITILQQQDELRLAQDRVGALFQQLETSHQIGQRQQTLIETISQQLEITQAIVPQLEAENNDLREQYQQQTQKLSRTQQVAQELHRRMKHQSGTPSLKTEVAPAADEIVDPTTLATEATQMQTVIAVEDKQIELVIEVNPVDLEPTPSQPELITKVTPADAVAATAEVAPPNPPKPENIPAWMPTPPTSNRTISPSTQVNWREAIASSTNQHNYNLPLDNPLSPTVTNTSSTEVVNKESTETKPSPNWPAPTLEWRAAKDLNPDVPIKKTVIDLPKFPKKK